MASVVTGTTASATSRLGVNQWPRAVYCGAKATAATGLATMPRY
jgi:hypothetical protein